MFIFVLYLVMGHWFRLVRVLNREIVIYQHTVSVGGVSPSAFLFVCKEVSQSSADSREGVSLDLCFGISVHCAQ